MAHRILLVDDETSILNAVERTLRGGDYEIYKAFGGKEGIRCLETVDNIAVIICDQRMPDIMGVEVLKKCKEIQPKTVRIALTGYCDMDTLLACLNEAHVSHFVAKPWNDDHLKEIVRTAVQVYAGESERKRLLGLVKVEYDNLKRQKSELERTVKERTTQLFQSRNDAERSLLEFTSVLGHMIEMHAPGLHGHVHRVAELSKELAKLLGLGEKEIEEIEHAALLHDIGMVSLPQELLSKPKVACNKPELRIFERHTSTGYELLKGVHGFEGIAQVVKSHHEHVDGNGYPDGLIGSEIPLGAKIISLADAYDTWVYPRATRAFRTAQSGFQYVMSQSGRRLDEKLVDLFLKHSTDLACCVPAEELHLLVGQLRPGMRLARDLFNTQEVVVLKADTELNAELINALQANKHVDPVTTHIWIARRSIEEKDGD